MFPRVGNVPSVLFWCLVTHGTPEQRPNRIQNSSVCSGPMALFLSASLKNGIFGGPRERVVTSDISAKSLYVSNRRVQVSRYVVASVWVGSLSVGAFQNIIILPRLK